MRQQLVALGVHVPFLVGEIAIGIRNVTAHSGKEIKMAKSSVVLVHGGFVDGSGWEQVYKLLKKEGYPLTVVQNPTISLADDVAATKRAVASAHSPVILVGHSYGGVVITEAGNDPKVAGLVYGVPSQAALVPLANRTIQISKHAPMNPEIR